MTFDPSARLKEGVTAMTSNQQLVLYKIILLSLFVFTAPITALAQIWTVLSFDAKGDTRDSSLADAAQLSYRYDKEKDFLWFRVTLYGKPNEQAFGVNIVIDTGKDEASKVNWWGGNKAFKFDRIITAWVTRGNNGYQGTIGVADAAGVSNRNLTNLLQNNVQIRVEGESLVIGVKRTDICDQLKMKFIAAVGSSERWNDDIPNVGAASVDLSAERPKRGLREIDVSRNNFRFPSEYRALAEDRPPLIKKGGKGRQPLVLIPGVYSGQEAFDGFIARNQSEYKFYLVTPPGLMGTPARELPPETTSYGDQTWTRRLERDVLELIKREKLNKPIILAHGFPGSLVAREIATQHPQLIGGVIDIAATAVQPFPSPNDATRKTPATPHERVQYIDEAWARTWFKYVTPETWESNNYPAVMFANDAVRAERVRQQVETVPLPVKVRYLTEFMAADQTNELASLSVPTLVLRPGFNEKLLADPATSWFKVCFQDSWDAFAKNPQIQMLTVTDGRALLLDDQPQLSDEAIRKFIEKLPKSSDE
jgi:pimeloyl-ACP methyl ester carboxylesterase